MLPPLYVHKFVPREERAKGPTERSEVNKFVVPYVNRSGA